MRSLLGDPDVQITLWTGLLYLALYLSYVLCNRSLLCSSLSHAPTLVSSSVIYRVRASISVRAFYTITLWTGLLYLALYLSYVLCNRYIYTTAVYIHPTVQTYEYKSLSAVYIKRRSRTSLQQILVC